MKYNPQKGIIIGVSINLAVIIALVWVSYLRVQNEQSLRSLEVQKNKVITCLDEELSNMARMQNSAKGYAILEIQKVTKEVTSAGKEKYINNYNKNILEAERLLIDLNSSLDKNVFFQQNLKELNFLINEKIQYFNQLIEYAKYKNFENVKDFFLNDNLEIIDKMDQTISTLKVKEDNLFLAQKGKKESSERKLQFIFIVLFIFSIALSITGFLITRFYLKQRTAAAASLEENKQLLQSIIDNTTNPIFIKEINGQYLFANKQFASMFGPKDNPVTGKTDNDLFPKDIVDKIRSNDLDVIKAGKELRFEEIYPLNNELHTYIMVKFPISGTDGKVYAVGGIATDISEQKKTQFQLVENEGLLKTIFDVAPDAIIMIDRETKIVKWNLRAEELFGWKEAEVNGKSIYDVILPKSSKEEHLKGMKQFLETGEGPYINKRLELFAIKKNRVIFEVEIIVSSILINGKNFFIVFLSDITRKKQLEQENQRTKNFLSSVLDNIPDMIFVKEAKELRFVTINKTAEKILGYQRWDMIGKNDFDFFPKEQAEFFTTKDKEVMQKGELVDIPEEAIDTKSGKRWLHTKKLPLLDEKGKPLYLLGISEDITEKRKLEDEKIETSKKMWENEQRLALILENIGEGVFVADTSQKTILFNHMAEEILELKGESFSSDWSTQYNIYYPDGITTFPSQDLPTEKALKGDPTYEREIILEDPESKKRKLIKVSGQPVRDENNNIIAAVTTIRDMTKYKEMEKALEESELKYRKLIGFNRS